MSFVSFPYRWLRAPHLNIIHAWHDITGGIKSLLFWVPVIWEDRWYDSDYMLRLMHAKFQQMADRFEEYGHHLHSDRDAHRMKVCAELCRRMLADNYGFELEDQECGGRCYFSASSLRLDGKSRDMKYLGHLIGKYMVRWWD